MTHETQTKDLATNTSEPTSKDKSRHLEMVEHPGKSHERLITDVVAQGLASNAWTANAEGLPTFQ